MNNFNQGPTPEFLSWVLSKSCTLRGTDLSPEQAERQLRPLEVLAEAQHEDRIVEGIVYHSNLNTETIDKVQGFQTDDVFAAYGGEQCVADDCGKCMANISRSPNVHTYAGCFGTIFNHELTQPSSEDGNNQRKSTVFSALDSITKEHNLDQQVRDSFGHTTPGYYALWLHSELNPNQVEILSKLIGFLSNKFPSNDDLRRFQSALVASRISKVPIKIQFSASGIASGSSWTVDAHCPKCRCSEKMAINPKTEHKIGAPKHCIVCGHTSHFVPQRKRKARGSRPYWEIVRFMGDDGAKEFVEKVKARRSS